MKYSYYPGCTLRTKARELDKYARESAKVLGFELEEVEDGSAAEEYILWEPMRLQQSFPPSVP